MHWCQLHQYCLLSNTRVYPKCKNDIYTCNDWWILNLGPVGQKIKWNRDDQERPLLVGPGTDPGPAGRTPCWSCTVGPKANTERCVCVEEVVRELSQYHFIHLCRLLPPSCPASISACIPVSQWCRQPTGPRPGSDASLQLLHRDVCFQDARPLHCSH